MRFLRSPAGLVATAAALVLLTVFGAWAAIRIWVVPDLPEVASIREIKLEVPLRVYTRDGKLIGEFGTERRATLKYQELPQELIHAFLDAEDDRFFEHSGVDWYGIVRAALRLATTGEKAQGGSTITMQLARNVFLSSEKTYTRKLKEILLARRIEAELTKEQILETYLNKIFLGNRAYGVGAAAQVYFGKDVHQLTLSQIATIAGLPKAPSRHNPVANPKAALDRRNYVLRRMRELGHITEVQYKTALAEPISARLMLPPVEADAHYVAEMARAELFAQLGESIYTDGYLIVTTLDSTLQGAANRALRQGLLAYEERHGWNGVEAKLTPQAAEELESRDPKTLIAELDARTPYEGLIAAAVLESRPNALRVRTVELGVIEIGPDGLAWAALTDKNRPQRGDIVRVWRGDGGWRLGHVPQVQGALVALDPRDGAVRALVGGFDFFAGNYNRAVQARRQAGSGFKPFLYAAAIERGYTPASIFMDAPIVYDNNVSLDDSWRPENYDRDFRGPMRLREALVQSRNLVSIRVLQAIGLPFAMEFSTRFGFPRERLARDLTLALGSSTFTPLEMARAYAVFANGGFRVEPYYVQEVRRTSGEVVSKAVPSVACLECETPPPAAAAPEAAAAANATALAAVLPADPAAALPATPPAAATTPAGEPLAPRVVDARTIYLADSMMRDVTIRGTAAAAAKELGRYDLAGKTGTTNDETDAWFNGFTPELVAVTWVGYDQPQPLGRGEVGGKAALPVWIDFMRVATKGRPETRLPRPPGIANVRIDPRTGLLARAGGTAIEELVQSDRIPAGDDGGGDAGSEPGSEAPAEDLF